MVKLRGYSIFGNVAVVNFPEDVSKKEKKKFAEIILKENKSVETVLEKSERFKGRLRKMTTSWVAGIKNKEVLYKENNCVFRFNIDETYFSPRLSNERKEIAKEIKKGEKVLVLFAGVGPFSIVIARNSKPEVVYSNELNRKANKYEKLNIELNKVEKIVKQFKGDAKRICKKLSDSGEKFDVIVMPRPQLKDSFLENIFPLTKKNTRVYYYDFYLEDEENLLKKKIKNEAKKAGKKIRIFNFKKAGNIGPGKYRYRVDFVVL
jgi:tRNA (guanine37-N1)-methyltransferase